jgi:hypothetical protein
MATTEQPEKQGHVQPGDTKAAIRKKQIGARSGEWNEEDIKAAAGIGGSEQGVLPSEINELLRKQTGGELTPDEAKKLIEWYASR